MLALNTYCSPTNPQGKCVGYSDKNGPICKPMDFATLKIYKDLQNQINRVLSAKRLKTIAVTGDIGAETLSGIKDATGSEYPSCNYVAVMADSLAKSIKATADGMKAPVKVASPPPAKKPSIITPSGQIKEETILSGFGAFLTTPLGMAVGLGTVIALYSISKSSKKSSSSQLSLL